MKKQIKSSDMEKPVEIEAMLGHAEDEYNSGTTPRSRMLFSSTCSTYMTLLGFSIGMSDFWRFPFLAYRNGGGAFLIPFVVMIVLCGFPLYFLEYSVSKFSGRGPYRIWDICPMFRGIGITIVLAYSLWMIGTTVLRCWIIDFLLNSFRETLPWTHCDNPWNTLTCRDLENSFELASNVSQSITNSSLFTSNDTYVTDNAMAINSGLSDHLLSNATIFDSMASLAEGIARNSSTSSAIKLLGANMTSAEEFWQYYVLELSSGMSDFSHIQWRHVGTLVIIRVVIFCGLIKSIKSIEKVIYVTATVPFFLTVAIFIRSLMLPGAANGLIHFIYPDFEKIMQPRVWIEATLMTFYTLGFGWGGNMLLGSHAHFKENSLRTSIVLPLCNMFMAVFSGMVCFSVLGNMAHSYGVEITEVINAGMSVGIVAYITALSALPFPQIWTVCFVAAIILTGIDGQLVPMDMLMQVLGDLFPKLRRIPTLIVVGLVFFMFSLPTCTGAGAYIFLWMDWYNGAWIGPIVAFVELVTIAWIYGMDRFNEDVQMMIGRDVPMVLRILAAFIAPIIVLIIFLTSCVEYVPPSYGEYVYPSLARVLGWVSVALVMSPMWIQAVQTVRAEHGTIVNKLQQALSPLSIWGPCEGEFEKEYKMKQSKFKNRNIFDLFVYNLFGRVREQKVDANIYKNGLI
ncbi:sodium-dependent proline transporter-like isoform X2 [Mya arenaria]|nr:sodium-dependent proline transporter-like isoform X2 [Mya arenaria]